MNNSKGASLLAATAMTLFGVLGCATNNPPVEPKLLQAAAVEPVKPDAIQPEAERILKATSEALANAKQLSFTAEVWDDQIVGAGHKLSTTKELKVQVARPDRLHVEILSPKRSREIWYDGKTATMLDRVAKLYGTVNAPATIDSALDALWDKYGIVIPMDDLIVANPYASAQPAIRSAAYFGKATILGVPCEHVGFSTEAVDWQLWVEDGGQRLPRKVVITYKWEDTAPQYTAIFSDWNLNQPIAESSFVFTPPSGSAKIEVLPRKADAE